MGDVKGLWRGRMACGGIVAGGGLGMRCNGGVWVAGRALTGIFGRRGAGRRLVRLSGNLGIVDGV